MCIGFNLTSEQHWKILLTCLKRLTLHCVIDSQLTQACRISVLDLLPACLLLLMTFSSNWVNMLVVTEGKFKSDYGESIKIT